MKQIRNIQNIVIVFCAGLFLYPVGNAKTYASNIDPVNKWAWGTNIGWINFRPTHGGVTVYSDHLEGYAWCESIGWIRMGTHTGGGAYTYSNATAADYGVNRDVSGNLSGYAWSANARWINFSGVTIDPATGSFDGYAYGESIGYIHFKNSSPAYNVVCNDMSLPVALSAFYARAVPGGVQLSWITESETDNLGFVLERGVGCVETRFIASLQWEVIASYETHPELCGQGNSAAQHNYTFVDKAVEAGTGYVYRLSDVNTDGEVNVYDVIQIALPDAPVVTAMDPPFPNPFNPQTKIEYHLAEAGPVKIVVYDLLGREVRMLVDELQSPGSFHVYWQGNDRWGEKVATGMYLIVLKTADCVKTQKVMMMR